MSKVNARILNKILTTDVDFTLPPNEDYETFEGWNETDLAVGEIGLNTFRGIAYVNYGEEILPLIKGIDRCGAKIPKTYNTVSFITGDDGDTQRGRDGSILVLGINNPYGNNTRFLDETGATSFANGIIIDWSTFDGSTVLGYYKTLGTFANYNDTQTAVGALTVAGYSDWYIPNLNELINIAKKDLTTTFGYAPFGFMDNTNFWTSNTVSTANCYTISNLYFQVGFTLTSGSCNCIPVRVFTVSGTTLT